MLEICAVPLCAAACTSCLGTNMIPNSSFTSNFCTRVSYLTKNTSRTSSDGKNKRKHPVFQSGLSSELRWLLYNITNKPYLHTFRSRWFTTRCKKNVKYVLSKKIRVAIDLKGGNGGRGVNCIYIWSAHCSHLSVVTVTGRLKLML